MTSIECISISRLYLTGSCQDHSLNSPTNSFRTVVKRALKLKPKTQLKNTTPNKYLTEMQKIPDAGFIRR